MPAKLSHHLLGPVLGSYSEQVHGPMFPESVPPPASAAVVPLMRHGRLIGCLNLGSNDAKRFALGMGTDFIEHLASIISSGSTTASVIKAVMKCCAKSPHASRRNCA